MTRTSSSSDRHEAPVLAGASPRLVEGSAPSPARRRARATLLRITRAVGSAVIVLWGAATVAFFAQLALPGDRATIILNIRAGQPQLRTAGELAQINQEFGLDRPVIVQYFDYLTGLVRGDFGTSYQQFRPVAAVLGEQLGATVTLSLTAILFAWIIMVAWV